MISARLLVESGVEPETAIERVRAARPGAIETPQQVEWVSKGPRSGRRKDNLGGASAHQGENNS
jgi:hypothetical protein